RREERHVPAHETIKYAQAERVAVQAPGAAGDVHALAPPLEIGTANSAVGKALNNVPRRIAPLPVSRGRVAPRPVETVATDRRRHGLKRRFLTGERQGKER